MAVVTVMTLLDNKLKRWLSFASAIVKPVLSNVRLLTVMLSAISTISPVPLKMALLLFVHGAGPFQLGVVRLQSLFGLVVSQV